MEQHEELTMNTTPAFADNLAQLRATHNMTQEQLAERLGVSRQSVSKWESGVCLPELATLDTLCGMFDCTLDNLLRGSVAQADLAALEAYDAGWNRFARAITFGTAMVLLGVAASGFAMAFGLRERTAGVLWILAVAVFLVWSFLFDAWKISWLTFVVAGLLTGAVGAAFSREGDD